MRVFIAIFPSKETLDEIRNIFRKLDKIKRNFRFIELEQIHLTMKFLGANVSQESLSHLIEEFKSLQNQIPAPEIEIGDLMYGFPGQQYPNVMFLTINQTPELKEITEIINKKVKQIGLEDTIKKKDRGRDLSHMTIGRVKRSVSKSLTKATRAEIEKIDLPEIKFKATELYFMESVLTITGPVYKKLFKIELK